MTTWIFTATSRTGQPVNPITKAPTDSVAVYTQADLDRRIAAAKSDPRDLIVTVDHID
jgi:acyl-CoA reductase-like NAD-dependent aldehyde dehydrogenase